MAQCAFLPQRCAGHWNFFSLRQHLIQFDCSLEFFKCDCLSEFFSICFRAAPTSWCMLGERKSNKTKVNRISWKCRLILFLGAAIFSLHELDFHLLGARSRALISNWFFLIHERLVGRFRTQPMLAPGSWVPFALQANLTFYRTECNIKCLICYVVVYSCVLLGLTNIA